MDNRVWTSGAAGSPPSAPASPSTGYPSSGDPLNSIPATKGGAFWFHQIGEELRAVLTAAGITPSTANNAQLLEAIQRLIDAQSGNYALDTGVANNYVVALSPAITAYADGMTVRVKIVNANTGASTLNAGGGAISLVNDVGAALANGDAPAGSVFAATYIASANKFYINSIVPSQAMSQAAADARYAALAGLSTQTFSVGAATAAAHAVQKSQLDSAQAAAATDATTKANAAQAAAIAADVMTELTTANVLSANNVQNIAHGLGRLPKDVVFCLLVTTAVGGWAVGDEIYRWIDGYTGVADSTLVVGADGTNITVACGPSNISILNKTTAAAVSSPVGNFKVRVRVN